VMDNYKETSQSDMQGEIIDGEIVEDDPGEK
jgi:hypothetical protein